MQCTFSAQQVLQHLLESLVYLQDLLLFQNKETKPILDDQATVRYVHVWIDWSVNVWIDWSVNVWIYWSVNV